MAIGIEDRVKISPAAWPTKAAVPPGDLTKYAPVGLGLAAPLVMNPWDDLERVFARGSFYGASERSGDPIRDAPVNDAAGGVIYFDSNVDLAQVAATADLLGVRRNARDYAVFATESSDPPKDRYLAQIRIVEFGALNLFGAVPGPGDEPWLQTLTVGELLAAFISAQLSRWGRGMSSELQGTLGGDGDWAKEKLAFGLMVENADNGVLRIWSRPWLVTK